MPFFLVALFWLVVTVHGEVRHQAGPMTARDCALQMAVHIMQTKRLADESGRIKIRGRVVATDDVEIACLRGELAS